ANQLGRVIQQQGGTFTVRDLTLTGGLLPGHLKGGGLSISTVATIDHVTVTGNVIDTNEVPFSSGYGAGLYGGTSSSLTITDSSFTANAFIHRPQGVTTRGTGIAADGTLTMERTSVL